ncbi:hypothetical protein CRM90_09095 [Mycobacterium sp. ENV421]|uniref:hypothetical protein n=1 Tax=Mycobacterium sp. ENV421 TaxID=1213407 RepID=UPI000C9A4159|nr:hypothetical protein [Mycobacterium sp. ENV421]PND58132.1 hypothetical protein CRM90_09095 [Mycobacterium sp. ENV421]
MTDTDTDIVPDADETAVTEDTTEPDDTAAEDITDENAETFPRSVVEKLRQENGRYRQRAHQADAYAQRLHTELVRSTGRLADPTDLPFDAEHLDDTDALTAAIDALLADRPHLASRKPVGDIGQGNRGGTSEPFSLLGMLKERT